MVREGYKETELGEVPVEWEVKSFSEACDRLLNGGTPNTQVPKYWDGSIPWVTGADVVNQKIQNIRRYITKQAVEDSSTSVIPKECLLVVTRTGVGKLAITPFDVAISQDITGVIPKKDYDIGYLFWVLNASGDYFQNLTQGTSINGITRNDLIQFKFAAPPLPEQRRIAAVLSTIDEAIEKTEALIAKLRQVKAGLMQDLLTKGIDEEGRVRSEETHVFCEEDIGSKTLKFPECWELDKVGHVITLKRGYDLPSGKRKTGDIPVISSSGISGYHQEAKVHGPGVVTGRYGTLGEVFFVEGDFWPLNTTLYVCNFKDSDPKFINYFLKLQLKGYQNDAVLIPGINRNIVHKLSCAVPPLPEQYRIAAVLTAADDRIAREETYRDKLLAMKKGLMADLLTGRVRVPEGVAE